MHFHLPKPLHGWREFAGEVGIIVIGVLIALSAEQVVETIHARHVAVEAQASIRQELLENSAYEVERIAIGKCLTQRLGNLATALASGRSDWSPFVLASAVQVHSAGMEIPSALRQIYHMPSRDWLSDAYTQALARGDLTPLNSDERTAFAEVYNAISDLGKLNEAEQQLTTTLAPLQFNRPLSDPERNAMIQTIARLDSINSLIVLVSRQNLQTMQQLHFRLTPETLTEESDSKESWKDELAGSPRARTIYGDCVDRRAIAAFDPALLSTRKQ